MASIQDGEILLNKPLSSSLAQLLTSPLAPATPDKSLNRQQLEYNSSGSKRKLRRSLQRKSLPQVYTEDNVCSEHYSSLKANSIPNQNSVEQGIEKNSSKPSAAPRFEKEETEKERKKEINAAIEITTPQKIKRKKHRPKVVQEGTSVQTPHRVTPKPTTPEPSRKNYTNPSGLFFGHVYKRRRTVKVYKEVTDETSDVKSFTFDSGKTEASPEKSYAQSILPFGKVKSKTRTRVLLRARCPRKLADIIARSHLTSTSSSGLRNFHGPDVCMETLLAEIGTKTVTKKRSKKRCSHYRTRAVLPFDDVISDKIQRFKHMNMFEFPGGSRVNEGVVVPFTGCGQSILQAGALDIVRKECPRAKVDFDTETERVWNLLMGKNLIDQGEGLDADKKKWWEGEREVFRGRVVSFIARMRLVQGDRRFSQWKGSVVDSVVGVFLTQNVADNLSSSAFMALAATFPHRLRRDSKDETIAGQNVTNERKDGCFNDSVRVERQLKLSDIHLKDTTETSLGIGISCLPLEHTSLIQENNNESGIKEQISETMQCPSPDAHSKSQECCTMSCNSLKPTNPDQMNGQKASTKTGFRSRKGNPVSEGTGWDRVGKEACGNSARKQRSENTMDSLDWEAVRNATLEEISTTIRGRGMNNVLAGRIKDFLDRLVRDYGRIDLEWLRDVPPDKVKDYLLSIRGLGLKSVECVRLLTLQQKAFPVDTNVGRICVRLGWVPLQPLPESLQLHLLELYPVLATIQKYLWPRLCTLDQQTLYELHYHMITFGKVFCTKSKPNCKACPMRGECRHFASAFASARLALPGPQERALVNTADTIASENDHNAVSVDGSQSLEGITNNGHHSHSETMTLEQFERSKLTEKQICASNFEPIIEEPMTPPAECMETLEREIEDAFYEENEDEIPRIEFNFNEFSQNLENYMEKNDVQLQVGNISNAIVEITAEAAFTPVAKLKNISRLRTEHHVYELPDSHILLEGLDKREPDDPCPYLLAIWTPGETAQSTEPPKTCCDTHETGKLCDKKVCFACNSVREARAQTVRGTLLIPCRTAMRGSFPLNGTYFQVNEVFADHDSSYNPINVPRSCIWNLPRRTVYFGTSVPTIFRGLTTAEIQQCFWRGFVCVRGFDRTTRAPKPLRARLHFPASKPKNIQPNKTEPTKNNN